MEATASPAAPHTSGGALAFFARVPLPLVLVLAATALWRVPFLVWTDFGIESDEAVLGLMARHIAAGERFPVWYYGQQYMGAFEAYVAAPFVALLGSSKLALKLTALLFALLFSGTGWALARRIFKSDAVALFTGLLCAAGPLFLTLWSLKLRCVASTWALGQAVLLVAHVIGTEGETPRRNLLLGVIGGLAIWNNLLVAPYLLAAALYLISRRRIVFSGRGFLFTLAGLLAGSAPFWLYNLVHFGATFAALPDQRGSGALDQLLQLWKRHLPVLLGSAPPWNPSPPDEWREWAVFALFGAGAAWLLVRERVSLLRFAIASRKETSGAELYLLVALGFAGATAFTRFGAEVEARYASVLFTSLLPMAALPLGARWSSGAAAKLLALPVCAALLAFNGWSIYREDPRHPTQPLHQLPSGDLVGDLRPLYRTLAERGIDTVVAEYWFAQIISYESGEKVAAWSWPVRADYRARFAAAPTKSWLFRARGWDRRLISPLRRDLSALGLTSKEEVLGDWILVSVEGAQPVPETWTITGSAELSVGTLGPHIKPENIADRIYHSRWTTQAPQRPGQFLLVDLGAERALKGFRCFFGDGDVPQKLRVEVSSDGKTFERLSEQANVPEHWQLDFERSARFVKLTQLGSSPWRWWSVHECYAL